MRTAAWLLVPMFVVGAAACERETRRYQEISPASSPAGGTRLTTLQPGAPEPMPAHLSPYEENAYGQAEGKRLFVAMNCNGCHAMGGGGIGPALMDDKWIYGAAPEQIFSTIVQGRPNGMPAFAGRLPNQQVWQLVSYVQSMSGLTPQDSAPGRSDDLNAKKPELRMERQPPKQTGHR
jgi:cytochrome c oxidase cbb3-type subunit III